LICLCILLRTTSSCHKKRFFYVFYMTCLSPYFKSKAHRLFSSLTWLPGAVFKALNSMMKCRWNVHWDES
jgi:hypothetical protein